MSNEPKKINLSDTQIALLMKNALEYNASIVEIATSYYDYIRSHSKPDNQKIARINLDRKLQDASEKYIQYLRSIKDM